MIKDKEIPKNSSKGKIVTEKKIGKLTLDDFDRR